MYINIQKGIDFYPLKLKEFLVKLFLLNVVLYLEIILQKIQLSLLTDFLIKNSLLHFLKIICNKIASHLLNLLLSLDLKQQKHECDYSATYLFCEIKFKLKNKCVGINFTVKANDAFKIVLEANGEES